MTTLTLIVLLTTIICYNEVFTTSSRQYKTAFKRSTREGLKSHVKTSRFAVNSQPSQRQTPPEQAAKKKGGKRATIVTVKSCNAEFCDPGWEPYPNIVSTVTGYNILKGNPYNLGTEQDPGFETGYIFVPVVKDDDDRYALHSGITIRAISKCDLSMNTKVVSTVQGYQNVIRKVVGKFEGWKTNPPVEVSAKGVSAELPPLIDAFAAGNDALREHAVFFSKRNGVLTINDATCAVYAMQISRRNPPPFQQPFKNAVIALARARDAEAKKEEFHNFIEEFGTHYVQKATIGARLSIVRRYSRDTFKQGTEEEIEKCNKHRLAYFYVKEQSEDNCTSLENEGESMIFNSIQKEQIISYGSKPSDCLTGWANQEFESPVPIKMTLAPIIDLFDADFMGIDDDLSDLEYASIKEWMKELYARYCEDMKTDLGIEFCNPNDVKRCGYNDHCNPAYEDCVQTSNTEYNCVPIITKSYLQMKVREALNKIPSDKTAEEVAETIDTEVFSKLHGIKSYVMAKNSDYGKMQAVGETAGMEKGEFFHVAYAWASSAKVGEGTHFKTDTETAISQVRCSPFNEEREQSMINALVELKNKNYPASFFIQASDEVEADFKKISKIETDADYNSQSSCDSVSQYIMIGPGGG